MGGKSYVPPPPDQTLPIAQMQMATEGQLGQLRNQNELAKIAAKTPVESWTPDIWGEQGAMAQQGQIAAINAFRSKQLEKELNPEAAALRAEMPRLMRENLDPKHLKGQMDQWARSTGLARLIGSGMQDSTIGKSAFFDQATQEAAALRDRGLGEATNWLNVNQAPDAGLDPGSIRGLESAVGQQGVAQRAGIRQQGVGLAESQSQSASDWINKMMSNLSGTTAGLKQDSDRYVQAQIDAGNAKEARKQAMIKAAAAAALTVATAGAGAPLAAGMLGLAGAAGGLMGGRGNGASLQQNPEMESSAGVYSKYN